MNGTPPASSTCAFDLTREWISGLALDVGDERCRERRDHDRAGERRPERGAEVGHRVLDAADLGALVVGHGRDRDGAELRGEGADPEADQQHRHEHDLGAGVRVERAEQDDGAGEQRQQAAADDEPRRDVGKQPRDADRGGEQRDRQREAAARRSRSPTGPRQTDRYSGTTKNRPACTRYWKKNMIRPPPSCRFRSIAGRTSGSSPRASTRDPPSGRRARSRTGRRGSARPSARGRPTTVRPASAGSSPTRPTRSTPKTSSAEAERREHGPDDVEAAAASRAARRRCAARAARMASTITHLAGEDPAPREVGRAEAADQRADRDGDRPGRRDQAVRRGPALGREVAGDERDDRGQDQRGADSLEERPAEQEHGQARAPATS